ncbi:hypothetical protein [uncultured Selenomonas sp.]|uniref:hypothetical protein n=1 Tax=uncultured Selenomonas sp. TaxID=159275 RepID=UPI0025E72978|nr:hypothetical protein [uncultured Selenomonas sp.]
MNPTRKHEHTTKEDDTMNPHNLKPIQAGADAKTKGRKGGIESGKSKRRKKKIANILLDAMKQDMSAGKVRDDLTAAGFDLKSDDTIAATFAYSILLSAMSGNMQAARLVLELLGEEPELEHKKHIDGGRLELKEREVKAKEDGW